MRPGRRVAPMIRVLRGVACAVFILVVVGAVAAAGVVAVTLAHFSRDLPDHQQIANYVPATGTKVYAGDGGLIAEFETEKRIPVAIAKVPQLVIRAFLAAEDRDFYSHKGVDPSAIIRATMAYVLRFQSGQRPIGASTITQQVVRHFLLTNEVSISRKVKEAILAYRIEHTLSKDRILEIYLNEIYLGAGAYGVAAAADTYFQKPLDQLTLAETAFLAALPKAPNNYHPTRFPAAAKGRRDWVVAGMAELGWISPTQAKTATAEPLAARPRPEPQREHFGYFAEEVRRELVGRFGEKTVYQGGMSVRTSYVPAYQKMAETAFRNGLVEYDRRHGWRGPVARLGSGAAAQGALAGTADPPGIGGWQLAAVTATDTGGATIALKNGAVGRLPIAEMRWARKTIQDQRLGPAVRNVHDVVAPGDIVLVEPVAAPAPAKGKQPAPAQATYALRQIPDVSGGLVVMDPHTGRLVAMVGGWSFQQSQFNRATQAKRQPGSAFKPFVFVTALQNGFTPSSVVEDAPLELSQGPGLAPWRPVNYEGSFIGATTLDDALIHSRNLVTARLATMVGLPAIAKTVHDFDIMDRMPLYYSMSLGAGETTLLRLTSAYAMLDNGGHWLLPSVVDVVQDRDGRIVYQKGVKGCATCFIAGGPRTGPDTSTLYRAIGAADASSSPLPNARYADNALVYKSTKRDPLVAPQAVADIVAMMQGVVERGTGTVVAAVGKPLAGKTGTTSDWFDAWFVGFSPDLAAGIYIGFDDPRTLGNGETGGHVAAPIFRDFMAAALKDKPAKPFPLPPGATPVMAGATSPTTAGLGSDGNRGSPRGAKNDQAGLSDPGTIVEAAALADNPGYGSAAVPPRRAGRGSYEYTPPPGTEYSTQQWSDYATASPRNYSAPAYPAPAYGYAEPAGRGHAVPRARDNVAARVSDYPTPWAAPGYAAPAPPGYAPPRQPGYGTPPQDPAPGWGQRPGFGTGGLY